MKSVKSTQHELKASTTWTGVEGALTLARAAQRVRVVEGPVLLLPGAGAAWSLHGLAGEEATGQLFFTLHSAFE